MTHGVRELTGLPGPWPTHQAGLVAKPPGAPTTSSHKTAFLSVGHRDTLWAPEALGSDEFTTQRFWGGLRTSEWRL